LKRYADEKEQLFRDLYANDIKAVAGLPEFLEASRQLGIDCAIATSAPIENVDFTLEKTGLRKYFKKILDESHVSKGKPDPEIYIQTAAALGYRTDKCIVFEDSLSGISSGRAAGCKVVGLMTTHTAEELKNTDFVMNDFTGVAPDALIAKFFP
jgi:beta-phosphoglucomutase